MADMKSCIPPPSLSLVYSRSFNFSFSLPFLFGLGSFLLCLLWRHEQRTTLFSPRELTAAITALTEMADANHSNGKTNERQRASPRVGVMDRWILGGSEHKRRELFFGGGLETLTEVC